VTAVDEGSPADTAGLRRGDTITRVDKQPVHDPDELRFFLRDVAIGTPVRLTVVRGGGTHEVSLSPQTLTAERAQQLFERRNGLSLTELTPQQADRAGYRSESTVLAIARIERGSPAQRLGLRRGDLVRAVNSAEVETLRQFRKVLGQARKSGRATLLIQRGYALQEFTFEMG
jgi:S1-C subfamily serine protease